MEKRIRADLFLQEDPFEMLRNYFYRHAPWGHSICLSWSFPRMICHYYLTCNDISLLSYMLTLAKSSFLSIHSLKNHSPFLLPTHIFIFYHLFKKDIYFSLLWSLNSTIFFFITSYHLSSIELDIHHYNVLSHFLTFFRIILISFYLVD